MTTNGTQKQRGNELAATGREVARNVKRIRTEAGMSQQELSDALGELGHPIPVASIGKIESGRRRVEVDDLVALAIALEANPNALLLPYTRSPHDLVEITGGDRRDALPGHERRQSVDVWGWGVGSTQLHIEDDGDWEDALVSYGSFVTRSLPWWAHEVKLTLHTYDDEPGKRRLLEDLYDREQRRASSEQDPTIG